MTVLDNDVTATVGQRVALSDFDVIQVLDIYQCHANDASRHAKALKVRGPFCDAQHGQLHTNFVLGGSTADKKPWYVSGEGGVYLYYDSDCSGDGTVEPRWIFDTDSPSESAVSDLDGDGACSYEARGVHATTIDIWRGVPVGRSDFQLDCGDLGMQIEAVTVTGVVPLTVSGQCATSGDGHYVEMGKTQNGRAWYANGKGNYLYFEADCDGTGTYPAGWVFDIGKPSLIKASGLSTVGSCVSHAYIDGDVADVPTGENTWRAYCSGAWVDTAITVADGALPPTPPPTAHPDCTDTDSGAVDSGGHACSGYASHFPYWCGKFDTGTFIAADMCCVCGGGDYPTDAPSAIPTPFPTPVPTATPTPSPPAASSPASTAVGDPHITNLVGSAFDVNKPGDHVLVRVPVDVDLPAQLEVRAKMGPTSISPCGLWISEVTFKGEWVGEEIRVHTARHDARGKTTLDHFAVLQGNSSTSVPPKWKPWAKFAKDVEVALSGNVTVLPSWRKVKGAASVKDRRVFEFLVGLAADPAERMSVTIAQASNPALDVQARRVGKLGVQRIGGLLGTEDHDPVVEEVSLACGQHLKAKGKMTQRDWQRVITHAFDNSADASMLINAAGEYEQAAGLVAEW